MVRTEILQQTPHGPPWRYFFCNYAIYENCNLNNMRMNLESLEVKCLKSLWDFQWRSLDMSGVERRRLFCAVLFHCAAALCVIWSLCVLIERAAEEVKRGLIGWPFWTKLVVVTVGLTGGVVFMYIQCRQYLHLCNRWRARNR